jgi:hypothetical protein
MITSSICCKHAVVFNPLKTMWTCTKVEVKQKDWEGREGRALFERRGNRRVRGGERGRIGERRSITLLILLKSSNNHLACNPQASTLMVTVYLTAESFR